MKHLLLILTCLVLLLNACKKKDESTPQLTSSGNSNGYQLVAPACLVTHTSSRFGEIDISYDNQKRIVRESQNHDTVVTTYNYTENTILKIFTYIDFDGSIETRRSTLYLNAKGLIDSTFEERGSSITTYSYNKQDYCIRQVTRSTTGTFYSGRAFEFIEGDLIREHNLISDGANGDIVDSTVSATYTYLTDKPNHLGTFTSWINRTGKQSIHAIKTVQYGNQTYPYTYVWGSDNLPLNIEHYVPSYGQIPITYTWKCN